MPFNDTTGSAQTRLRPTEFATRPIWLEPEPALPMNEKREVAEIF